MVSEAQIRANNKYNKKTYKNWSVRLKPEEYDYVKSLQGSLSRREWLLKIANEKLIKEQD